MALPNVQTLTLAAANSALLFSTGAPGTTFMSYTSVLATTLLDAQRRIVITSSGNDAAVTATIKGVNGAGFPISEAFLLTNGGSTFSNLDFKIVTSIALSALAAANLTVGTNSTGSTMWNIMNWHVTPTNIEASGVVTSTSTAVTWRCEYTYDDPNNLPSGQSYPQPFIHPTLNGTTVSLDGPINDPVTAVRFTVTSGTGTIRGTVIQAGLASP